jgi:hypothetical protein
MVRLPARQKIHGNMTPMALQIDLPPTVIDI